jgi:hypothetical protein
MVKIVTCSAEVASTGVLSSRSLTSLGNRKEIPFICKHSTWEVSMLHTLEEICWHSDLVMSNSFNAVAWQKHSTLHNVRELHRNIDVPCWSQPSRLLLGEQDWCSNLLPSLPKPVQISIFFLRRWPLYSLSYHSWIRKKWISNNKVLYLNFIKPHINTDCLSISIVTL